MRTHTLIQTNEWEKAVKKGKNRTLVYLFSLRLKNVNKTMNMNKGHSGENCQGLSTSRWQYLTRAVPFDRLCFHPPTRTQLTVAG